MAKIGDGCLELEITPRRYHEAEDDPFISTMLELLEHNNADIRDRSIISRQSRQDTFRNN
ncbi:hypothetical protein [Bacillus nakamurai]|uniref:hypothetical protein n=1 Tax=Bacillus nakamurai TaxID=1793963 RepID=UPI001E4671C2|nr:hypothetical protein [Bacillus nakamurai]MCC9021917.1 hypothetical protein [Bacillus nakamurai]